MCKYYVVPPGLITHVARCVVGSFKLAAIRLGVRRCYCSTTSSSSMRRLVHRGCVCIALALGVFAMRHELSTLLGQRSSGGHDGATAGQVERALGWSLVSGLATGVGGAVVFFLEPPSRHGAAVPERVLAFLLGLAVGVMMVLSILDMILPKLLHWGIVRPHANDLPCSLFCLNFAAVGTYRHLFALSVRRD